MPRITFSTGKVARMSRFTGKDHGDQIFQKTSATVKIIAISVGSLRRYVLAKKLEQREVLRYYVDESALLHDLRYRQCRTFSSSF